eukprot:12169087-Ditylum_brightwellii.AAC.1
MSETGFEDANERKEWFQNHDLSDPDDKELYNLKNVPTVYCDLKVATILDLHMCKAFNNNAPTKYTTRGTAQKFVPAPGIL